jgi:cytochrome c peroxidase
MPSQFFRGIFTMQKLSTALLALFCFISFSARADVTTAEQAAKDYGSFAKRLNPNSKLSAEAGRAFYTKKVTSKGRVFSCSDCHNDNPAKMGEHNTLGDPIKPLAPSANPNRFSDIGKSEKGFNKHCQDLYGKNCTPQEKGDFVTYLLTIK